MSNKNDGVPAFPGYDPGTEISSIGMSLRDYFAAKAMEGDMAYQGMEGCDARIVAAMAYEIADAMLEAREESK
jgi:hypothetical protein